MGKISLIIFIVLLLWQVIAQVLSAQAKKQEQKRLQELARRRQLEQVQGGGALRTTVQVRTGGQGAGPRGQPSPTLASQAATAAERRKAHLEELRARRQRRSAGEAAPMSRTPVSAGPQVAQPQPTAGSARGTPIRILQAGFQSLREQQVAVERQREASRREREEAQQQVALREKAEEAEQQRRQKQARPRQRVRADDHAPQLRQKLRAHGASKRTSDLRARLTKRETLGQLFLLKELLDQPLSIREPPS
jgi:hypothetical protein